MASARSPACDRAARNAMTWRSTIGYTALEVVFVAALGTMLSAAAVPQYLSAIDDFRASGATRYVAARLHRARMEAVTRSAQVAIQFTQSDAGYSYAVYADGNRNGVLARDIQRGTDRPIGAPEQLPDRFTGIDFGVIPNLPPIDAGGTPPGSDPIRLGSGNSASFSPAGTSTSGTVYIRSRRDAQYAVRIFGETGRISMFKFDRGTRQWRPL
jgi:type II secretory pathway pseudopilin PulG